MFRFYSGYLSQMPPAGISRERSNLDNMARRQKVNQTWLKRKASRKRYLEVKGHKVMVAMCSTEDLSVAERKFFQAKNSKRKSSQDLLPHYDTFIGLVIIAKQRLQ